MLLCQIKSDLSCTRPTTRALTLVFAYTRATFTFAATFRYGVQQRRLAALIRLDLYGSLTVEQPNIPFEPKGSPAAPTPHKSAPAGRRAVPADAGTNRRSPQPKSKAQLSFGISSRVQRLRGSADAITAGRVGTLRRARRRNRARRQVPRAHYCISKLLYGCRPTSTSPMRTYGSASAHRRCEGSPA